MRKSKRNQAQASKSPLTVESHRIPLNPPTTNYDNVCECYLQRKLIRYSDAQDLGEDRELFM